MKLKMLAVLGLVLMAGVFASNATNATKPDVLGLKYSLMKCRMDAVSSLVEYGEDTGNSSTGLSTRISSDMNSLKAYADSQDRRGFNSFVNEKLKGDVKEAVFYLKDVKKEAMQGGKGKPAIIRKKNNTNNTSSDDGKEYFQEVKRLRAECIQNAALSFARGQSEEFGKRVREMNESMKRLKNKSVNVSEMEEIENEAESNLGKLQDAIKGGNSSDIYETVKEIREQHLHIWARFHIARFEAILDSITSAAAAKGYSSDVDSINALLDDASSKVKVGSPYDAGDFELVKTDLFKIHQELKDLLKKLKGA